MYIIYRPVWGGRKSTSSQLPFNQENNISSYHNKINFKKGGENKAILQSINKFNRGQNLKKNLLNQRRK